VVLTADHGEEFGEHGRQGHGHSLYDEVLHVPFVVRAPGLLPAGRRVGGLASLVDVMPTLLDLLDVPVPAGVEGVSLAGRMRADGGTAERPVYAEVALGSPPTSAYAGWIGARKWIVADGGAAEAFDLDADPGELHPLSDASLLASGSEALRAYRERVVAMPTAGPPGAAIDEEKADRLRALGYVQ
jgi:uncharacterized sulfatase